MLSYMRGIIKEFVPLTRCIAPCVYRPVKPLRLYEFQGCPFCAKVKRS